MPESSRLSLHFAIYILRRVPGLKKTFETTTSERPSTDFKDHADLPGHTYNSLAANHPPPTNIMFRPTKPEDWEPYRELIGHLYTYMKLKDVMTEMQDQHHFKATCVLAHSLWMNASSVD